MIQSRMGRIYPVRAAPACSPRSGRAAAGYAISLGPVVVFFAFNVPAAEVNQDFVDIPFSVYPQVRALPFPSIADLPSSALQARSPGKLGPLIVYLASRRDGRGLDSPPELLRRGSPRATETGSYACAQDALARSRLFWLLVLLGALFFIKGLVRVSPLHMGASLILSVAVLGAAITRARHPAWRMFLVSTAGLGVRGLARQADHHGDGTIVLWWHGDGGYRCRIDG